MHNETLPQPTQSRALTVVPSSDTTPAPRAASRPHAGFLTQLIACERRLPAYRERRRCEPGEAGARYAAPPAPGRPRLVESV